MKLALLHHYHPVLRPHSSFTNCLNYVLYSKGSSSKSHVFSCTASVVSFIRKLLQSFSTFIIMTLLKITGQLCCKLFLNLGLSDVYLLLDSGCVSLAEISQKYRCILTESCQASHASDLFHYC